MKRNFAMTIAACLLVVTMLSLCMVSSTYAKYTTTGSSLDNARVAVWGFTSTGTSVDLNLFDDVYDGTVDSADGDNVIAPGTTKTATFAILNESDTKAPEVSYNFTVDTTGSACHTDIASNSSIKWYLDGTAVADFDALLAAIKNLSGDASGTKQYGPGTVPTAFTDGATHTIKWEWLLDGNDAGDTALGNAAVAGDLEVKIVITVTATQVD